MIAPLASGFAAAPALMPLRGNTALRMSGWSPQNAGDLPDGGWGGEAKAHSRNPTPTQLDPNDPKSKQTHIPAGESFEEYLRRRNGGAAAAAPAPAAPAYSPPPQAYQPPPQAYQPPPQAYQPPAPAYQPPAPAYQPPAQSYQPAPSASYTPPAGAPAQNAGDLPPTGWGGEAKAHSRDPTPTALDPNDPKSKQTHIPQGDSFEEYMRRRQQGF
eukprot:CAMPEP_0177711946 /NCGR_PEP_ID=MMETSP0484_2-20121128/12136_1 /TAXON_ID=354590 /ORGANISM="Rhodomonas lens, Strain RHODO" /LENGTH=213 /DNA_ID=CAMNT_0019223721 /DNA_START=37 /DNA_END=678 /DNA_ORIENTATION=+